MSTGDCGNRTAADPEQLSDSSLGKTLLERQPLNFLNHADCRPQRCPGCGGRVYLPCRLCIARAYDAPRRTVHTAGRTDRAPNGHPSFAVRSTERGELFALEFLDSPSEEGDIMRLIADSAAQELGAHPPCL